MQNSILITVEFENNEVDSRGIGKVTGNLAKSNKSLILMSFLTLSNADIQFAEKKLIKRSYIVAKTLLTIKQVEIINEKEFVKTALDENVEVFVVYVTSLSLSLMLIYLARIAQIALLITEEIKIPAEYLDFSDAFLEEKTLMLLEITGLNKHAIKLQESHQLSYELIYSLGQVELKTLKIYIETNLANGFTWPSKLPAGSFFLFVKKPDVSLRSYVNCQDLNNLTIIN